jgi:hypothetical protein
MILIVKLISRTFSQNVSKTALFELSLKKLFAELTLYTFSLKKLFCQNISKPTFLPEKGVFQNVSQKILRFSI